MIILKFAMRSLLKWREDMRLHDSGSIHPQHSWAVSFSLQFTFDYKDLFQQETGMQTGGGKKMWGVRECMRVEDPQTLFSPLCLFFLTFRKYGFDPQCGIISPFIPPLAVFLPLHLLFLPPLPPELCLPPLSLHFPSSLPLFSLTLKSSQSLCFPSFTASTCWQEEKEEDAALAPQCCRATSPVSADCLWLQLSSQLSPPEGLWRGGAAGSVVGGGGSGELAAWSSTGTTTAGEWSRATVLLWGKLPTSQQWPSPLPLPVSRSPLPPFRLPDPCGRKP